MIMKSHVLSFVMQGHSSSCSKGQPATPPHLHPASPTSLLGHGKQQGQPPLLLSFARGQRAVIVNCDSLFLPQPACLPLSWGQWLGYLAGWKHASSTHSICPSPTLSSCHTLYSTWIDDWLIRLAGIPTQRLHITSPPPPPYSSVSSSRANAVNLGWGAASNCSCFYVAVQMLHSQWPPRLFLCQQHCWLRGSISHLPPPSVQPKHPATDNTAAVADLEWQLPHLEKRRWHHPWLTSPLWPPLQKPLSPFPHIKHPHPVHQSHHSWQKGQGRLRSDGKGKMWHFYASLPSPLPHCSIHNPWGNHQHLRHYCQPWQTPSLQHSPLLRQQLSLYYLL